MKRDRRRSLRLERLEGKALLSAIHALQSVATPGTAGFKAGAAAGSVAVHTGGIIAPTHGRSANAANFTEHRIRPLGKLQLMSLSTVSAGGGFGQSVQLAHPGVASSFRTIAGLNPGSLLISPHGVSTSVHIASAGPGHFSFPTHAVSTSVQVSGANLTPNASALKSI
jgi:hypothetical protein